MDEAMSMAGEAMELHIEGLIEEEMPIPDPQPIEKHKRNPDYVGGIWAFVEVELSDLRSRATRVNITLPKRVLDSIDRFAASEGETRSGLLMKAATHYIAARRNSRRRPA